MTTTPAMPDLLREIVAYCREVGHDWFNLTEAEHMLATLQAQESTQGDTPAADDIVSAVVAQALFFKEGAQTAAQLRSEISAILALRPQAVPDWSECERIANVPEVDEALRLFADGETSSDQAVCIVQAVLTAQAKEGGA